MRFFEIDGFRLTELSLTGLPLVPAVSGRFAGQPGNRPGAPENIPTGTPAGQKNPKEKMSGNAPCLADPAGVPVPPAPGQPAVREPHYIHFLRRRNAEIQREKEKVRAAGDEPGARSSPVLPGPGDDGSPAGSELPGRG
jgi:hypothetical protein